MPKFKIGDKWTGDGESTYFIADISANHDGDLERAKMLIHLASESGANAAKFQNFQASKIVSNKGFTALDVQLSHQSTWKKSVFEVYQEASLPWEWTPILKSTCDEVGIDYFSAPYDFEAIDLLDPYVEMYKIGSGDITWTDILSKIAEKGKLIFLATGASDISDVQRAVRVLRAQNSQLVVMQCNTNYTGSLENLKHINLNVLNTYRVMFPDVALGLSDHTPGHATVLGAVALGATFIEKHFTDDNNREGPDHPFSMIADTWKDMVDRTRELESAMGVAEKRIAPNEIETVVVQRRCLRATRDLAAKTVLDLEMIEVLRPAPTDAVFPYELDQILGKRIKVDLMEGDYFRWDMIDSAV